MILKNLPIDGMTRLLKTVWKVEGNSLTYSYETHYFDNENEAFERYYEIKNSSINNEKTVYCSITEFPKDYWDVCGMIIMEYDHGEERM